MATSSADTSNRPVETRGQLSDIARPLRPDLLWCSLTPEYDLVLDCTRSVGLVKGPQQENTTSAEQIFGSTAQNGVAGRVPAEVAKRARQVGRAP